MCIRDRFISYALLYFAFELIHEDDLTKLNTRMYIYFMINGILLLFACLLYTSRCV